MQIKAGINALKSLLPILIGTAIYAFGLHYFIIPNRLMEGGITGVALLINYIFHIPLSVTTLVINIPLFIAAWKIFGKQSMMYTVTGTLSLTLFLGVMERLIASGWIVPFRTEQDYFLVTTYAGLTLGVGLGLVFRFGGTTGGTDIMARIVQQWKGWSIGQVILLFDVLVIGSAIFFIPKEQILYTFVAVFITSKVIDIVIEGAYAAHAFMIITDHAEEIVSIITSQTDRGATIIPAYGGYSKTARNMVYCVVYRQDMKRLKDLVRTVDPRAFIIINEVHDVLGEGFKPE